MKELLWSGPLTSSSTETQSMQTPRCQASEWPCVGYNKMMVREPCNLEWHDVMGVRKNSCVLRNVQAEFHFKTGLKSQRGYWECCMWTTTGLATPKPWLKNKLQPLWMMVDLIDWPIRFLINILPCWCLRDDIQAGNSSLVTLRRQPACVLFFSLFSS